MKNINSHTFYSCSIVLLCYANITLAAETKGQLGFDVRQFTEKNETQLSGYGDAELYWESEAGNDSIIFKQRDTPHSSVRFFRESSLAFRKN